VEIDDLISAGVIGLIDAIEKFDPTKETQFKNYAEIRIRGSILDELRSQDWVSRSVRQKTTQIARRLRQAGREIRQAVGGRGVGQGDGPRTGRVF